MTFLISFFHKIGYGFGFGTGMAVSYSLANYLFSSGPLQQPTLAPNTKNTKNEKFNPMRQHPQI